MAKHLKMYANSPTLATDENGKKYIKKGPTEAEKETARVSDGTSGVKMTEGMPAPLRHAAERRDMRSRHETEHAIHDHKKMNKKSMHERHVKEMMDMNKRHMKEKGAK